MQLGIYLEGTKASCLAEIDRVAAKEYNRFKLQCDSYQVFTGYKNTSLHTDPQHVSKPIKDTTSLAAITAAVLHFKEQVEDLGDDEECSFAFQITVHRRNPL